MTATLPTDFDAFLFASVGSDSNGMPLTVVTLLARLGLDPWAEAAALAKLSLDSARQRLGERLEAAPNATATKAEVTTNATRLVALLHLVPIRKAASPQAPRRDDESPLPAKLVKRAKEVPMAIYLLIGLILLLAGDWAFSTPQVETPMDTTSVSN
ncbi:MAG TPA: hypothetical protein VIV63_02435 [Steroidobacteraceae bacterium]